jgi:hypothetical protein
MYTVTAHTGSTKNGTYKLVTGTVMGHRQRFITATRYVMDVVIMDANGEEYVTTQGRIIGA